MSNTRNDDIICQRLPAEIYVHWDPAHFCYRGWIFKRDSESGHRYNGRVIMECQPDPGLYVEPTFELREQEAQALLDSLWRAGLRPTDVGREANVVDAQTAHILTLRESLDVLHKIALHKLAGAQLRRTQDE